MDYEDNTYRWGEKPNKGVNARDLVSLGSLGKSRMVASGHISVSAGVREAR